jgi:hypothetical protein
MRRALTTLLVVVVVGLFALLAYRIYDPTGGDINDMTWTETVSLASGKTATIQRHVRFQTHSVLGLGGQSSGPVGEVDSIAMIGAADFVPWTAPIRPMLLDRDQETQEWILIAVDLQGGPTSLWQDNGKPCPPKWAFRLRDQKWFVQPVPVNLLARGPNLLVDLRVSDDAKFSSAMFSNEAAVRKEAQMNGGRGVPYSVDTVGNVEPYRGVCKEWDIPHFLGPFLEKNAVGIPFTRTLNNFPRLP